MKLCQRWAVLNRKLIMGLLMDFLQANSYVPSVNNEDAFESVHNYISDENLIRKGAISARLGEKCIIPMNMRDGSLICIGKGNEDWNNSAPHGAGRVMSRTKAFEIIELNDFKESMKGIYSETISEGTKDESPMVYKPMQEIVENISDTVTIINIIKPIFNFKAAIT
jgi:RNA-splicing ligase RtcB